MGVMRYTVTIHMRLSIDGTLSASWTSRRLHAGFTQASHKLHAISIQGLFLISQIKLIQGTEIGHILAV